jgi:hypothetical protein
MAAHCVAASRTPQNWISGHHVAEFGQLKAPAWQYGYVEVLGMSSIARQCNRVQTISISFNCTMQR